MTYTPYHIGSRTLVMYLCAAKTGFGIIICPQTTAPAGKKGKLVTLGSRKELDCLVQFINDEFGEPAFEVKTIMSKYKAMREGFSNQTLPHIL